MFSLKAYLRYLRYKKMVKKAEEEWEKVASDNSYNAFTEEETFNVKSEKFCKECFGVGVSIPYGNDKGMNAMNEIDGMIASIMGNQFMEAIFTFADKDDAKRAKNVLKANGRWRISTEIKPIFLTTEVYERGLETEKQVRKLHEAIRTSRETLTANATAFQQSLSKRGEK